MPTENHHKVLIVWVIAILTLLAIISFAKWLPLLFISLIVAAFIFAIGSSEKSRSTRLLEASSFITLAFLAMITVCGFPSTRFNGLLSLSQVQIIFGNLIAKWNENFEPFVHFAPKLRSSVIFDRIESENLKVYLFTALILAVPLGISLTFIAPRFGINRPQTNIGQYSLTVLKNILLKLQRPWFLGGLALSLRLSFVVMGLQPQTALGLGVVIAVAIIEGVFTAAVIWLLVRISIRIILFRKLAESTRSLFSAAELKCHELFDRSLKLRNLEIGRRIGKSVFDNGSSFELTERNLNYHMQVVGGSGSGKSNFLKILIEDRIRKGHGLLFVDLKADFETLDWLEAVTNEAQREADLKVFSLSNSEISNGYNPVEHGTPSEIYSRIMQSLTWTDEYYRGAAGSVLRDVILGLCEKRDITETAFTLRDVYDHVSSPDQIEVLALGIWNQSTREILKRRADSLRSKDGQREITGLMNGLQGLIYSSAGPLLTDFASEATAIKLRDVLTKKQLAYFLMNSMQDKESSVAVGKMLLQDLINTTGWIYDSVPESERQPLTVIVDEFAAFATDNFIDLLNRARGAKIGIIVAHQSRGDLQIVSDQFCDQLERNVNTKVIFGTDKSEDAEYYAAMLGTQKTIKKTRQTEEGFLFGGATGMGSERETEEFVVHPNEIKWLSQGEALVIKRQVDEGHAIVQIKLAAEARLSERRKPIVRPKIASIAIRTSPDLLSNEEAFT